MYENARGPTSVCRLIVLRFREAGSRSGLGATVFRLGVYGNCEIAGHTGERLRKDHVEILTAHLRVLLAIACWFRHCASGLRRVIFERRLRILRILVGLKVQVCDTGAQPRY